MEKSTIWTPANVVTILRVALVPAWLALAETQPPTDGAAISVGALLSAALFVLLALTDKLDGYLARSRGEVTTFGKFLDPIADKLVVIVALCFLLEHGLVNSWVLLLGRSGVVTQFFAALGLKTPSIYGFFGIVLVLALKLYPFIFMYVSGAMKKLDPSLLEASQSLGCGPARNVACMVIPLILPTVLAGSLLVFMSSLADFGTPMLIGEGFRVMPVLVYREFMGEMGGNANFAAAIAVVMVSVTTSIYLTQRWIVNRLSFKSRSVRRIIPKDIGSGAKSLLIHGWI